MTDIIPVETMIAAKTYLIRGVKVILDRDLADPNKVETAQLKGNIRRNIDCFPNEFMFELDSKRIE